MADTLEEALSFLEAGNTGDNEVEVLEIDSDLRIIHIPDGFVFGVYNDKNVYDVHFTMPRYYRGIDLSEFNIQVNYMTPVNVGNIYLVENPTVEEESIDFVWILDRGVFLAAGSVQFSICLRQIGEDGAVLKEFNTTIARANVLSGLEIENNEDPESYSLLAHMKQVEERIERQGDAVFASYSDLRNMFDTTQNTQAELSEQLSKSPRFAATASEMTDTEDMYIYTGSEPNYRFGAWYYYDTDTNSWKMYGETNVDSTLTVSGVPADAKVVGDRLAVKANVSDVNRALNTKADADDVEDALDLKANITDMNAALNLKANVSDVEDALDLKVDKVTGKQLSTEDFTSELKTKLDGVAAGATNVTVDSSLSSSSTNPVQNKVINTALGTKLATTGDSKDLTTTFTSSDVADANASSWTSVGALANTEKHSSIFAKVSQMFKNVRYLFKMLGTTDISSIGNGTVSGALSAMNAAFGNIIYVPPTSLTSGAYSDIETWIKANFVASKWIHTMVSPTTTGNDTGVYPFKTSSFSIFACLSSTNYGWGFLQSDNSANNGALLFRISSGTFVWNTYATGVEVNQLSRVTSYQATYVSNSYTTETDVKRIWVYREGKTGYVHFNLAVGTALPSSAGTISIGKISGPTLRTYYTVVVPSQSVGGSHLLVNIQQNGDIEIANYISSINATGFFRAEIPVSFTD